MKLYARFAMVIALLTSCIAHADPVTLLCRGKSSMHFEKEGKRGSTSTKDGIELVLQLSDDRLTHGEISAACEKTETVIGCSAKTPKYELLATMNRYSGHLQLSERLHFETTAVVFYDVLCSPAKPKF